MVSRAKHRFPLWHPKSTDVVVVVGTAAVVVVDEVELLVDASVAVGFVDDEAPHDLAKEIHSFRLAKACTVPARS
jgi:siroheme synthase (precorrin-2 oxidase/ferrochelatase)